MNTVSSASGPEVPSLQRSNATIPGNKIRFSPENIALEHIFLEELIQQKWDCHPCNHITRKETSNYSLKFSLRGLPLRLPKP